MEVIFADNNAESTNAQNKFTVVPTRGNFLFYYIKPFLASNNNESLAQITLNKPNENFPILNPIQQSLGTCIFSYI